MSGKILIVDDLAVNRKILRAILCNDYEIFEASSGEEAFDILNSNNGCFSAVLLDVVMPEMNGMEALRKIRDNPVLQQLPVIMITSHEDEEIRKKALSLGANDFVIKPYNPDILRHCLQNNIALFEAASTVNALQRDKLTGLYNREAFFARVNEMVACREAGYYIMACFDIDKFKVINDQYGMKKGDEVLRYIAGIFKEGFEKNGGICCRVAADDFAVLYPTAFKDSETLAQLRRQAANVDGLVSPIVFSIGRYIVSDLSLLPSSMYDRAMLAAESVKGRYDTQIGLYDETMRDHLIYEQEIVTEMAGALGAQQFEVWFQPQYNHSTGALIGAEALVRWRHPKKGVILPGKFIPVFEQNGFIYAMDKCIWEEVCRYLRKWIDAGIAPLPVSVNISRYDVFRPDIVEFITGLIKRYDIPVDLLRLEITESAFSESTQQIVDTVKRLIDYGFTVEIDDFGNGYSSLNTLKDVPAQIIKLDMKFLQSSNDSQRGGNIVESIIRMAKWLDMSVIAEGVETIEQANYLRSIGCNYIQGYLYSELISAEEYEKLCSSMPKEEKLLTLETVETLDNNSFWDPMSMDTLIFNSYVGGACIYEYCCGNIELLRATEKYAQIIGNAGMTVEDALKLNWTEHLSEADKRKVLADLEKSAANKQEVTGEYVFLDLPGCPHETYLRSTMRVIACAGERRLVYCTNENITAQRKAEQREREAAEKMRLIMANVNGGICAASYAEGEELKIVFANEQFYAMHGYTKEQFESELSSPLDTIHPEDREKTKAAVERLVRERDFATYEYRCVKRDGSIINVCCNNSVTEFSGLGDTVLLSVTTDTTELTLAKKKEKQVSEQLQTIMKSVNCGVSAIIIDEDGRGRVAFANEKYYSMLGYTREQAEFEINYISDTVYPQDLPAVRAVIDKLQIDRKPHEHEYRCVKRDGSIIYVHGNKSVANIEGYRDNVIISVITDVTQLVAAEQKAQKMSERLQAIMDNVDQGIVASVVKGGSVSFIFANDRYYEMLGYTAQQYMAEVKDPFLTIDDKDRERVLKETDIVTRTGTSVVLDYDIVCRDGSRRCFRNAISVGKFADVEELVQLSIFRDITQEKETQFRERKAAEQVKAIMDDIDCGISAAILNNGKIELLFSNDKFYNLYGYTREQYLAEIADSYDTIHPEDLNWVKKASADAYESGAPTQFEYRIVCRNGEVRWVRVGLSSTRFTGVEQNVHLCIFTDITNKKQAEQKLRYTTAQLTTMMNDIPGGFIRMQVCDGKSLKPLYVNEGFCNLTGMSYGELAAAYKDNIFAAIHPDDVAVVHDALDRMLENGEAYSSRFRMTHKSGSYVWLMFFGRISNDHTGNSFLNIYFTNVTRQVKLLEQQKELLDNLPCGAALYETDGKGVTIIHLNRRYWELVGREPVTYNEASFLNAVYEADRDMMWREIAAAIRQQRNVVCNVRVLYGENEYRPFHVVGNLVPKNNGKYSIYATYTPISDETVSYQEVLTIVLSTIMESTTNLTFAKDLDFRYICTSRAFANMVGVENANDIIGKTDYDLFEKEAADKYRHDDAALMSSGKSLVDIIEAIPSADGIPHYSSTSKYILRDATGKPLGIYGIGRDVTEYRDTFEKLKLLTDSIPGGLATYECSSDGIKVIYFNDGFCNLFGYSREEYEIKSAANPISLVFDEDMPMLTAQIDAMIENGTPTDCVYRIHVKDGSYKWISHKGVVADKRGNKSIVNAMLQDITDQREMMERLRLSEEENNLAIQLSGNIICRYTIADKTLSLSPEAAAVMMLPETIENVPYGPVQYGMISQESEENYIRFFENILSGSKKGSTVFQQKYLREWRWLEAKSSTVFSDSGKPVKAVISFFDITELLEKEAVYKKWQQSLAAKRPDSYTLFRCNISKDASFDTVEGSLLDIDFNSTSLEFNDRTREYAERRVVEDDKEKYIAFLNSDTMLANYYRGKRSTELEYREKLADGDTRWLKVSVELVEYPNSEDVEAYLMYENINEEKQFALQTKELAESDPLTGVLNRAAFISMVERKIRSSVPEMQYAMMMLDIDGFKQVNDVFGHGAGDQALIDIADSLRSTLRRDDLLGRLGGDEFLVFLSDIPDDSVAANKAKQICSLVRKTFSLEVQISGSVGVAIAPRDGENFETLYKNADSALYYVKNAGKDNYAIYRENMIQESDLQKEEETNSSGVKKKNRKRRMLFVNDSRKEYELLCDVFKEEFIIEKANDLSTAMIRMRHFGSAISVIILDSALLGADVFSVLYKMQSSAELQSVPVIIITDDEDRESCLKMIRSGATDFVTRPVDSELLSIRVHSAVSKAENERLRAKNSYLELQNDERIRYETAIESTGIAVIEYDWLNGSFVYFPSISMHLAGYYDSRKLWHILLSDLVADTATVQRMQTLVHNVADDRERLNGSITVTLKTPERNKHRFRMNVRKLIDEYQLTHKLIITLIDLEPDDNL